MLRIFSNMWFMVVKFDRDARDLRLIREDRWCSSLIMLFIICWVLMDGWCGKLDMSASILFSLIEDAFIRWMIVFMLSSSSYVRDCNDTRASFVGSHSSGWSNFGYSSLTVIRIKCCRCDSLCSREFIMKALRECCSLIVHMVFVIVSWELFTKCSLIKTLDSEFVWVFLLLRCSEQEFIPLLWSPSLAGPLRERRWG